MATKAQRQRQQTKAIALSKKLMAACEAMNEFMHACMDCGEFSKGADDGRNLLMEDMAEYASYMESVYGSGPRAAE